MVHCGATALTITVAFTILHYVFSQNQNPLCQLNITSPPTIELTSSISTDPGNIVHICPGEDVHFNCTIIQSNAPLTTWAVNETTSQLIGNETVNAIFNGYDNIEAVLNIFDGCEGDTYVLESKLSINNYSHPTTKIACSAENEHNSESLTAQKIETPQYVAYYYNQRLNEHECRLHLFLYSLNNTSGNLIEFMLYENGQSLFNGTIRNNTVTEISYNCSCKSEIINNLTIRSINNRCIEIPITKFTYLEYLKEPIPSQICPPTNSIGQSPCTSNGVNTDITLIIGIAVPTSTVIVIALIVVSNVLTFYISRRYFVRKYDVNKQQEGTFKANNSESGLEGRPNKDTS